MMAISGSGLMKTLLTTITLQDWLSAGLLHIPSFDHADLAIFGYA